MKRAHLIFTLLFCLVSQLIYAQEELPKPLYKVQVYLNSEEEFVEGYLYELMNTSIVISSSPYFSSSMVTFKEINVVDIKKLKFKNDKSLGTRVVKGASIGFVIGATLGYFGAKYDSDDVYLSEAEGAIVVGSVYALFGGLFSALIGGKSIIKIKGSKETYWKRNKNLKRYLITN